MSSRVAPKGNCIFDPYMKKGNQMYNILYPIHHPFLLKIRMVATDFESSLKQDVMFRRKSFHYTLFSFDIFHFVSQTLKCKFDFSIKRNCADNNTISNP